MLYFASHKQSSLWGNGRVSSLSPAITDFHVHPIFAPSQVLDNKYFTRNAGWREYDTQYEAHVKAQLAEYGFSDSWIANFIWGRLGEEVVLRDLCLFYGDTFISREGGTRRSVRDVMCYWFTINGCKVCKDGLEKNNDSEESEEEGEEEEI